MKILILGWSPRFCIPIKLRIVLMLLVFRPHSELAKGQTCYIDIFFKRNFNASNGFTYTANL